MKAINHTFKKDLRSNISFYAAIGLLTMFAVFLSAVGFSDAAMIKDDIHKIMTEQHVEDAQFLTALEMTDEDISALEEKYDARIEQDAYLDYEEGEKSWRIFRGMDKVNVYTLLEGDDITGDNEILFDRDFADSNSLETGSTYVLDGHEFLIKGIGVRPDYLYSKKNDSDPWVDKENFGMILMTASGYDKLRKSCQWQETRYYSVEYGDEERSEDFRRDIYENFHAYSYISDQSNSRINTPATSGDKIFSEAIVLIPVMAIVILILVAIVIGRMLEREQKYIGTLAALGYRRGEIGRHYMIYAIIPGIIGSVLGMALALIAGRDLAMYFVIDFQKLNYNYYIRPLIAVLCMVVPSLLFGLVAYRKTMKIFRRNVVSMLAERDDRTGRKHGMLEKSSMSFRRKFRIRELFSHPGRTVLILFCLLLSAFMCLEGFAMKDMVNDLVDKGAEKAAVYEYSYYLNHMELDSDLGGVHGISTSYETPDNGASIGVMGVPEDSRFGGLEMKEGSFGSGFYISNAVSVERGLHKGDSIEVANPVTLEKYELEISGVVADNTQQMIYTTYDEARKLMGLDEAYYNVVYSDEELPISGEDLAYVSDSKSMLDTFESAMSALSGFINGVMFMGVLMSVVSVYLVVNMIVESNKSSISMLKVLGYRDREINGIVLNTNHVLVILGFLLALPMCIALLRGVSAVMVSRMHVVLEPSFSPVSALICAAIIIISYFVSLFLLRRKVSRIDMVVSLKGNRE